MTATRTLASGRVTDAPGPHRALVLIAEDDPRAARVLAKMLREDGYAVETALDGAAAIARLSRDPLPDVLVSDYRMPHTDGLTVARYARSRSPDIRVVLVTGYAETVASFLPRAAESQPPSLVILEKPLSYQELITRLPPPMGTAG